MLAVGGLQQARCFLQQAAPCLALLGSHVSSGAWQFVASGGVGQRHNSFAAAGSGSTHTALQNDLTQVMHGFSTATPSLKPPADVVAGKFLSRSSNISASQQPHSMARSILLSQGRQALQWKQQLPLYSVARFFSKSSSALAPAPADAAASTAAQQQQQQKSATSSASEPASSFINAVPAAAATGPPAAAASAATAAAAAASIGGVLSGGTKAAMAEYSMRQVSKHASDDTCWIVVNGKVYDVTAYIDDHPGGSETILLNAGVDCTEEFMGVHSQEAKELLEKFLIGTVKAGTKKPKPQPAVVTTPAAPLDPNARPITLADPKERYALPLAQKQRLNHDTFFMRFVLPSPQHQLGLPCGKHVFLCADIGGEGVVRAYTPISGDRDLGVLDFLIKVYWAGVNPLYPQGGKMTQHLAAMKEGDTIDVKGPYGKFSYEGRGSYNLNRVAGKARYMSMISGGSGVTPCYSVLQEVLRDPQDSTICALIYANKHEEDIWLKEELETMARDNPERFHLWYVVEEPGTAPTPFLGSAANTGPLCARGSSAPNIRWTYSKGYITHDMMAQHLLPPRPMAVASSSTQQQQQQQQGGSLALMCGPSGMLEHVVVPGLSAMGYTPEQMVVF